MTNSTVADHGRFAAANSQAKREWNEVNDRYEMSWLATISEKEAPTERERAEELQVVETIKSTNTYKVDTYVGIDYGTGLPVADYLAEKQNTPCVPTLIKVTKFLPCGLTDQKLLFGAKKTKRYMAKQSALDLVFAPRELRPCEQLSKALSLSTNENDDTNTTWIPISKDPLELMSANEQYSIRKRNAQEALASIKQLLGDERFELLVLSAEGMNAREIAEKTGGSYEAIKKSLQRIKKQLMEAQQ